MKKIVFLFSTLFLFLFSLSQTAGAWLDCPYGEINDPYPGLCARYIDTNNNQICDHSEPFPGQEQAPSEQKAAVPAQTKQEAELSSFILLIFLIIVFYGLHWYLAFKTNPLGFRYFWNVVLVLSFLPTGISGLLLLFKVRESWLFTWHNYTGLIFTVVALIHFLVRLKYFTRIPPKKP